MLLIIPVVVALGVFAFFSNSISFEDNLVQSNHIQNSKILESSPLLVSAQVGKGASESVGVKDNVEIIVRDAAGKTTAHITGHNKVVTHGENCAAKMLFGFSGGDETGTTVCVGELSNGFNFIGLGEGTTAVADGDLDLENPADETGLATPLQGSITWTNSTNGSFHSVLISATFTNTGSSEDISEIALLNATDTGTRSMYARYLPPSPVTVTNGGDITINWTIESGEATVP